MDSFDDARQRLHVFWRRARKLPITFQPKLREHYSSERIRKLLAYSQTTPLSWTIIVSLISPFPCLVILISIDAVPLASPRDGSSANYLFWVRDFVTMALMTRVVLEQFQVTVPALNLTSTQVSLMPIISSGGAVVFMIGIDGKRHWLPFTLCSCSGDQRLVLSAGRMLRGLLRQSFKSKPSAVKVADKGHHRAHLPSVADLRIPSVLVRIHQRQCQKPKSSTSCCSQSSKLLRGTELATAWATTTN
ncbi:hypothetical protein PHYSODRAFT_534263 [Phytophthora sojae]|uniref:Uncharacterized protein n=1 Tax=Phytophthora sojae (strain P6497) TaxID=1094619 RepID=G5AGQ6_PHYSP|nr:hypothetical protein PHYSODRAFT_534263 [Phytophthora sojae]EGZ05336.1 hypothetical protein PHYSODRAFT_534263 [Phytophthora sojae]|eukprot:XP_009539257.1 hypothetical protein PHYSODRAFT_534263 [Phytophthora sojae]